MVPASPKPSMLLGFPGSYSGSWKSSEFLHAAETSDPSCPQTKLTLQRHFLFSNFFFLGSQIFCFRIRPLNSDPLQTETHPNILALVDLTSCPQTRRWQSWVVTSPK